MTSGRVGQMSIDGTPISAADVARMEAEEALHAEWARKAVRVVAASSTDAEDCRTLLSILGLDSGIVREAREPRAGRGRTPRSTKRPAARRAPAKAGSRKSGTRRRTAA